jgi:isopenicillin N synthase-like dioxygenase
MKEVSIATVDYNDYISGDPVRKAAFIQKLGDAFSEIGFAIVANHGVSEDLKDRLYTTVEHYFAQPDDVKKRDEDLASSGQRGYVSKGRETAKGFSIADLKEFFHVGQEVTDGDPIGAEYPPNIWPEHLPEFREVTTEVYRTFENTGRNLLRAIALYLDLEENYFDDKIRNGNSVLRLLHYYAVENTENVPEGAVRAGAHEDINLITLLMGASAAGLQALTKEGRWLDVKPEPNQIVINMGDMLQRLTNGRLKSTTHRVINLTPEEMLRPRYSTPFFLHPRREMDLTCLPGCVDAAHPKRFSDMTAGEYLDERLVELGLKEPA